MVEHANASARATRRGHPPRHLARVKFLSRLFTALNLLPSIATLGMREEANHAAQRNEACAHLADGSAIVLAEVGNRLVIGDKPARQPHHLNVARSLTLEFRARQDIVEVDRSRWPGSEKKEE